MKINNACHICGPKMGHLMKSLVSLPFLVQYAYLISENDVLFMVVNNVHCKNNSPYAY